jgi:hypothetical protein
VKKKVKIFLKKLQRKIPHECKYEKVINLLYCDECGDVIYPQYTTMSVGMYEKREKE